MLDEALLKNVMTFAQYSELVKSCVANGTTSGEEQLPERVTATVLNAQRMKRISKQAEITSDIVVELAGLDCRWTWVLVLESWCGDGAQNGPVIAKVAELNPNIDLKVVLRDENPEFMDKYLTNGSRSVPKLICYDAKTKLELGVWGPRSKGIQDWVIQYKKENSDVTHDEFVKNLHARYALDKTMSLQIDLLEFVRACREKCSVCDYVRS